MSLTTAKNVLGDPLESCSHNPKTGFFRDGYCNTNQADTGTHIVCAVVTEAFLSFTKSNGNDLSTPRPEYDFPGLKPGDGWCLCVLRWKEALDFGVAPKLKLRSTHEKVLKYVDKAILLDHAIDC